MNPSIPHGDKRQTALDDARKAVAQSERFQGTGAELSGLRDALRALIQHCEEQERHVDLLRKVGW